MDTALRTLVMNRLSDPRHAAAVTAAQARVTDRLAEVTKAIGDREAVQIALSERLGRMEITLASFDIANEPLAAALARLNAERDSLAGTDPGRPIEVTPAEQLGAQWDDSTNEERRAMLITALGPTVRVVIDPPTRKGGPFDPQRVRAERVKQAAA